MDSERIKLKLYSAELSIASNIPNCMLEREDCLITEKTIYIKHTKQTLY